MKLIEVLNLLWYLWKRNNWMLDPRSWFGKYDEMLRFLGALEYTRRVKIKRSGS